MRRRERGGGAGGEAKLTPHANVAGDMDVHTMQINKIETQPEQNHRHPLVSNGCCAAVH